MNPESIRTCFITEIPIHPAFLEGGQIGGRIGSKNRLYNSDIEWGNLSLEKNETSSLKEDQKQKKQLQLIWHYWKVQI